MRRVRVLLAGFATLEREVLVETLAEGGDLEVVGWVDRVADIGASLEETDADLVVLTTRRPQLPRACERVFQLCPQIRFLALEERGRNAAVYVLAPQRLPLGPIWPERLAAAITEAARTPLPLGVR